MSETASVDLVDPKSTRQPLDLRRAAIITASVGIAHAALLIIALFIVRHALPGANAPDVEFTRFYEDDGRRRMVLFAALYLIPFAGIAFIWFTVALRSWLQGAVARLNRLFADILLVCGIIYVALLFCDGAAISTVSIDPKSLDGQLSIPLARLFPHYGASLFLIFAMRMAAMTVFAISNIARSASFFPVWFVPFGLVVGLTLLLTSSVSPVLTVVFPGWIIVFCVFVILHARSLPGAPSFGRAPTDKSSPPQSDASNDI